MSKTNRRDFFKLAGKGAAATSLISVMPGYKEKKVVQKDVEKFKLAIASYTFREFNLEDTLKMTLKLGLKRIAFKSFHLPLESSEAEINSIAQITRDAGVELYGCGVVYMANEDEVHRAFNYAKTAGINIIIGVPDHHLLGLVNEKVQEYDIKVAIHNHGPGDQRYPTPESAYQKIKGLDSRIGLCMDIGHTQRSGIDPAQSIKIFRDRVLDVHIKDVSSATKEGSTVEIGRGVINIAEVLQTLININYSGMVAFEHEKDGKNPLPGVAESLGYVKGVLSVI